MYGARMRQPLRRSDSGAPRPAIRQTRVKQAASPAEPSLGNQALQRSFALGTLPPGLRQPVGPALGNQALQRQLQRQPATTDKDAERTLFVKQLLHSHWASVAERSRFIRAFLRRYLAPATGGEPDSDLLWMWEQHYEKLARAQSGEATADKSGPMTQAEMLDHAHKMEEARQDALKREKDQYPGLLGRVKHLGEVVDAEDKALAKLGYGGGGRADFSKSLAAFRKELQARLAKVPAGEALPPDLDLIMKSLALWSDDPGNIWGEDDFTEFFTDHEDLELSSHQYATVAKSQNKCSAFVAESVYQSVGVVHKVYQSREQAGKWFPYRAADWGNLVRVIPHFQIVSQPVMGDIWSNGSHVGIFLGEYAGKKIYISARDDGDGVFGLLGEAQHEEGIQIKFMPDGGVFRRYTP